MLTLEQYRDVEMQELYRRCMRDTASWTKNVRACAGAEVICVEEMESNEEVWADWLKQENKFAVGDRKSMEAGGGKYLNFIKIVLRKK